VILKGECGESRKLFFFWGGGTGEVLLLRELQDQLNDF
jgi:hypothetical protein